MNQNIFILSNGFLYMCTFWFNYCIPVSIFVIGIFDVFFVCLFFVNMMFMTMATVKIVVVWIKSDLLVE